MKTPSTEYFTVVTTLQKGFLSIFSNTISQIGPVQRFLLVNLVSTFLPVLKAAAFSLEAMDWFERFPGGLL